MKLERNPIMTTRNYIDMSKDVNEYNHAIAKATLDLANAIEAQIEPFEYDEEKTECFLPAYQKLGNFVLDTIGFTQNEFKELLAKHDESISFSELMRLLKDDRTRYTYSLETTQGFIEVVKQLIERYFDSTQPIEESPEPEPQMDATHIDESESDDTNGSPDNHYVSSDNH